MAARDDPLPPLRGLEEPQPSIPAPAWLALLTAWLGLVMLAASVVFVLLPGSKNPREELQHLRGYSAADRFLPLPIYGIAVTLFMGIVVLWQMRHEPRPLPAPLVAQRVQAWVGMTLALIGAVAIYAWVGLYGPR